MAKTYHLAPMNTKLSRFNQFDPAKVPSAKFQKTGAEKTTISGKDFTTKDLALVQEWVGKLRRTIKNIKMEDIIVTILAMIPEERKIARAAQLKIILNFKDASPLIYKKIIDGIKLKTIDVPSQIKKIVGESNSVEKASGFAVKLVQANNTIANLNKAYSSEKRCVKELRTKLDALQKISRTKNDDLKVAYVELKKAYSDFSKVLGFVSGQVEGAMKNSCFTTEHEEEFDFMRRIISSELNMVKNRQAMVENWVNEWLKEEFKQFAGNNDYED